MTSMSIVWRGVELVYGASGLGMSVPPAIEGGEISMPIMYRGNYTM